MIPKKLIRAAAAHEAAIRELRAAEESLRQELLVWSDVETQKVVAAHLGVSGAYLNDVLHKRRLIPQHGFRIAQ